MLKDTCDDVGDNALARLSPSRAMSRSHPPLLVRAFVTARFPGFLEDITQVEQSSAGVNVIHRPDD